MSKILIYGANGFVGREISRLSKEKGLNPVLAGRNKKEIQELASSLELDYQVFSLSELDKVEQHISEFDIVMNCAGPYIETFKPIVHNCIKHNTHYLDLSGEIPVYEAIYNLAKGNSIQSRAMLISGIGFDVAPTDCLALHLHKNFKSGSKLTIAFKSDGPAGLPPGTIKTMVSLIPYGNWIRKEGKLIRPNKGIETKFIKYTSEPIKSLRITWGDLFTAYHSTGIPNIEVFASFPKMTIMQLKFIDTFRRILSRPKILNLLSKTLKGGSSEEQRKKSKMFIYAELSNPQGKKATCRMNGPEGGFVWTSRLAVEALLLIKSGVYQSGYQTPASAFGSDFGIKIEGVRRGEIEYI